MKTVLIFTFLILLCTRFSPGRNIKVNPGLNFQPVKVISDREDTDGYLFSRISDALLTSCKDIIILDCMGPSVSKYDWDGKLLKRISKKGKGPGDFLYPTTVCAWKDKIYILDKNNFRIAETDPGLDKINYIELPPNSFVKTFDLMDNKNFVINPLDYGDPDADKIKIFGQKGNIKRTFFSHTPVKLNTTNKGKRSRLAVVSAVTYGFDDQCGKIMIGFKMPNNPMDLYLYTTEGKQVKKCSVQMDGKYKYNHAFFEKKKFGVDTLKGLKNLSLESVFYYSGHWYVFGTTNEYQDGSFKMTVYNYRQYVDINSFYLKYNADGKFVGKYDMDSHFECFYISKDGYVLGRHPDSEVEELVIYKLAQ